MSKVNCQDKVSRATITFDLRLTLGAEIICQHPRWKMGNWLSPRSVYMSFEKAIARTTYVVVSSNSARDLVIRTTRDRLANAFAGSTLSSSGHRPLDPYLLNTIILQEVHIQSKKHFTCVRHNLWHQLGVIFDHSKHQLDLDRKHLKDLTNQFHEISQDADRLIAHAEMATMIADRTGKAHDHLRSESGASSRRDFCQVDDSLRDLVESLQSRKRWLMSYKSRKDTIMNLVS